MLRAIQIRYRLPPQQAALLHLLLDKVVVSTTMIEEETQLTTDAAVAMYRLRNRMDEHGIEIMSQRSVGYWIDDADKLKIKEAIEKLSASLAA